MLGSFIFGDYSYSKIFFMSENYINIKYGRYVYQVACEPMIKVYANRHTCNMNRSNSIYPGDSWSSRLKAEKEPSKTINGANKNQKSTRREQEKHGKSTAEARRSRETYARTTRTCVHKRPVFTDFLKRVYPLV